MAPFIPPVMPAIFQKKQGGLQPIGFNQNQLPDVSTRKGTSLNEDYSRSVLPPSALDNLDENWLNDPVPVDARNINIGAKKL
jgi:hypothetical protein